MENILKIIAVILFFTMGCVLLFLTFTNNEKFLFPKNRQIIIEEKLYIKKVKRLNLVGSICAFLLTAGYYFENDIFLGLGRGVSSFFIVYIYLAAFKWTK
ncbi:MAG: hypothetical protein ACRCW0_05860 [Clostridium sp.]